MALINCPECGQQVSDKATNCPRCAYPLSEMRTDGMVRIKMAVIQNQGAGMQSRQKVSVLKGCNLLWEGYAGQTAEFHVDKPIRITVKYHTSAFAWGTECIGEIDLSKSKKYAVQKISGFFKSGISLHSVDFIDSE